MSILTSIVLKMSPNTTITSPKESIVPFHQFRLSGSLLVVLLLPIQLVIWCSQVVFAEKVSTEKWNISADKVTRYEKPRSIVAEGNVILEKNEQIVVKPAKTLATTTWAELLEEQVTQPAPTASQIEKANTPEYHVTTTIKADWMVYDMELESIKAKGNTQIITNSEKMFAKEVTLSLSKETGVFTDATVLRNELSLHLEGKTIEKTGFDTYRIDDGWVITCKLAEGQTPPWSFSSSNTDIRKGGYAVLTHARFNIKNVPIFYTPFMILPAKNTRQSGFLYPYFTSSSNSGIGLNLPFFLNISDSADATFYPEYHIKRGFMPGVEFRYVSSATDKGMFTANYLDDPLSDPSETDYYNETGYTHDNSDRYWIRGKANHTFGDGWQTRLDLDIVSDEDYLNEFNSGSTGFRSSYVTYLGTFGRSFQNQYDTNRQNSLKTLRSFKGMSLEANLLAINESYTQSTGTDTPLWKLPGISFSGTLPLGETKNYFNWNTSYVDYWREDGTGGHRIDLKPAISAPIPLFTPYLETLAQVALRETFYYVQTYGDAVWDEDDVQNRFIPEYKIETATTLERDFLTGEGALDGFTHQVRPFIKYHHIPSVDQTNLPQWDDVDVITSKNTVIYGMDNTINPLSTKDSKSTAVWDAASLRVEQAWDLHQDPSDEPLSAIFSKFIWAPVSSTKINYKTAYDIYESDFTLHSVGGEYRDSRGDQLILDYSFKEVGYRDMEDFTSSGLYSEIQQINATFRSPLPFLSSWIIGGRIEHSLSQDETIKADGTLTYMANCWSVTFETQHTPADTSFIMLFNLANIGSPFGMPIY